MANVELMKRLRTRFLRMRHPQHFNMNPIAAKTDCGTVMCIAGHTLDLAGYKMRLLPASQRSSFKRIYEGRTDYQFISPRTGMAVREPLDAAAEELGLDYSTEAHALFHDFKLKTPEQAARRIEKLIEQYDG